MAFSSFTSLLSKLDKIASVFQQGRLEMGEFAVLLTRHPLGDLTSFVEVLLELENKVYKHSTPGKLSYSPARSLPPRRPWYSGDTGKKGDRRLGARIKRFLQTSLRFIDNPSTNFACTGLALLRWPLEHRPL